MFTLLETCRFSQEIRKSRFLAVAAPVADEVAARAFIAASSDPAANHDCWAWRIGQAYRFSDDGEPSGTAGRPILQALDGQALDHVAVVVTRWFGGILLGSGGLMRAYGGTAANCLREAAKAPVIPMVTLVMACGFSDLALVKSRLQSLAGATITAENFHEGGADLTVSLPLAVEAQIAQMLGDLTSGRIRIAAP